MALNDFANLTRPGQEGATGSVSALHIAEYTGVVEQTIARKSALAGYVPVRTVQGTSIIQNFAVGESTLQKIVPGQTPDGTINKFGKNTLQVDTTILARSVFPKLDVFQTSYDARKEVGDEHGKKIAKFRDQTFFIQAIKAGLLTTPKYTGMTGAGHFGGSQVTFAGALDYKDPAKVYAILADLFTLMENKDVDPRTDDVMVAVKPELYYTLMQAEQLINGEYLTSEGTKVQAWMLKSYGVPIINSNNFVGGQNITGHMLSNAGNSNAYDGDFTKVRAVAFSPRALLAGATIPLTTAVFWDEVSKHYFVDAYEAFAVGPNRAEFAGVVLDP